MSRLNCTLLVFIPLHRSISKLQEPFFPMNIGNYWVSSSSNPSFKNDTVKITHSKTVDLGIGYYMNAELWIERNDSIYIFQHTRGGGEFSALQYFPYDKELGIWGFYWRGYVDKSNCIKNSGYLYS